MGGTGEDTGWGGREGNGKGGMGEGRRGEKGRRGATAPQTSLPGAATGACISYVMWFQLKCEKPVTDFAAYS